MAHWGQERARTHFQLCCNAVKCTLISLLQIFTFRRSSLAAVSGGFQIDQNQPKHVGL